jgi:hypothetical protein
MVKGDILIMSLFKSLSVLLTLEDIAPLDPPDHDTVKGPGDI